MILDCYNALKVIEPNLAMYVGDGKLNSIHKYILGYYQALFDNKIVLKSTVPDIFHDWVANRLGYNESTAGWVNMILAYCMGFNPKEISWEKFFSTSVTKEQHSKSVRLFYELIEQFRNEQNIKI